MKVLDKAKTPEGYNIQIEDWTNDYSCFDCYSIAAYPIAKRSSEYKWIQDGNNFRLDINRFKTNEEVYQAFNDLQSGNKQISDYKECFWNGKKDCYLLGL